jgi:hypothetical protein
VAAAEVSPAGAAVGLAPAREQAPPGPPSPPARTRPWASWLVLGCYLAGAVILTWHLWVDPAGLTQTRDPHDVDLFAWFIRYAATAVEHGRLPALITTALNAPQGVSLMWNTSFLLPGVLLTPVTLLAGPQVSLTLVLTLSLAGSAASLYLVLRRWGASVIAAALGGAVYGFSPAMVNSGFGHYHLVLAVLPPLITDALLRIVTGRGHAVRTGAWLGLLTAAQLFTGEELLVDTALAGLVLVVVLAAGRPRAALHRMRHAAIGLGTGLAVLLLLGGHALWVQFEGPLREHSVLLNLWSGNLADFVEPSGRLLFHTPASAAFAGSFHLGLSEELAYLGWPLLIVGLAAAIRFWRDPRVRAAAVTCLVLELCNLGGGSEMIGGVHVSGHFFPWNWLDRVPGLAQVLPDRFCILGAGAAGAVLAFSLDLARTPAQARGWRTSPIPLLVAALAIVPLIPVPYQAGSLTPVPAGWHAAFARLRLADDAPVLVVPVPLLGQTQAMRWQADTGEPGSLNLGYLLGPGQGGQAAFTPSPAKPAAKYLNALWDGKTRVRGPTMAQLREAVAYLRPQAVVADTSLGSRAGHVLTALFGRPTFRVGSLLVWRR